MAWFKEIARKFSLTKESVFAAIFAVVVSVVALFDHSYMDSSLLKGVWLLIAVAFALLLVAVMLVAAFAVFRSVVKASAGFTILIFLAQTYCGLSTQTPEGVQALTFLWGASFLYILFEFGKEFQKACKENLDRLGEDRKRWEGKLMIVLFSVFALAYIGALYQVLNPIVSTLCIYN